MPYIRGNTPSNPEELLQYVDEELRKIATAINELSEIRMDARHSAPIRPRDGLIVYADGSDWSPVSGQPEGFYVYERGAWRKFQTTP